MVLVTSLTRSHLTTNDPLSWSSQKRMVFVLNSWLIPPIYIILYHFVDQKSWSRFSGRFKTKDTWICDIYIYIYMECPLKYLYF